MSQSRGRSRGQELDRLVDEVMAAAGPQASVVDLGGGTGGQAVRLASAGHRVTVVDPSADALAAVARRASDAGVPSEAVAVVQGDAETLTQSLPAGSVDAVLCHGVLEFVDDPASALASIRTVLRPGGLLSLRVTLRDGAVLARVVKGQTRQALEIARSDDGRWGAADSLQRRFTPHQVQELVSSAGFEVSGLRGLRTLSDVAPEVDSDHEADLLAQLDAHAGTQESLLALAPALHLAARVAAPTA